MTVMHEAPPEARPQTEPPGSWWRLPAFWGAVAIVAMWLAVLFVGVYGGDMQFISTTNGTTIIPSAVVVAIAAAAATAAIARRAFSR